MTKVLLPENVAQQDGAGAAIALDSARGKPLLLTLGITRIVELESLEVSVWGSPDSRNWKLLQAFPRKAYCGTYSMALDLSRYREVRHLRAQWKMIRWGRGQIAPLFGFYLLAEDPVLHAVSA
jgi:hypothetical protein